MYEHVKIVANTSHPVNNHYNSVVSLTRGSWALLPPATETLWADSRAVTCCPEDGRLTFEGWVVVVKELKPTAISEY
jgi:hypothetical protein